METDLHQNMYGKEFYHITTLEVLKSILEKGLLSHQTMMNQHIKFRKIYEEGIVARRKEISINVQIQTLHKNWANLCAKPIRIKKK